MTKRRSSAQHSQQNLHIARRSIVELLGAIMALLSPLMLIGLLIAIIVLLDSYGAHRGIVQRMATQGKSAMAVVSSVSPEYGWAFVDYEDAQGNARSGVLELAYYPVSLWKDFARGDQLAIRYLPFAVRSSDRVILDAHFDAVRTYRGYLKPDVLGLLAVCWISILVKPQLLYVGLVDAERLSNDAFSV